MLTCALPGKNVFLALGSFAKNEHEKDLRLGLATLISIND